MDLQPADLDVSIEKSRDELKTGGGEVDQAEQNFQEDDEEGRPLSNAELYQKMQE